MSIRFNRFGFSRKHVPSISAGDVPFTSFTLKDVVQFPGDQMNYMDTYDNLIAAGAYSGSVGLVEFDGTTLTKYTNSPDPAYAIWAASFDDNGKIHLGQHFSGTTVRFCDYNTTTKTASTGTYRRFDTQGFTGIFCIAIPGSDIVLATSGGASNIHTASFDGINYSNTLDSMSYGSSFTGSLFAYDPITETLVWAIKQTTLEYFIKIIDIDKTTGIMSELASYNLGVIQGVSQPSYYNGEIIIGSGTDGVLNKLTYDGASTITLNYSANYPAGMLSRGISRLQENQYILTCYGGSGYDDPDAFIVNDSGSALTLTKQTQMSLDMASYDCNYNTVGIINGKTYVFVGSITGYILAYEANQ